MRIVAFVLRLLLLSLSTNPASGQDPGEGDTLLKVAVLARHGDRASQGDAYITDIAEEVFFRGPGQLSTQGVSNARRYGESFRTRYITNCGKFLVDGRFNPAQVDATASDVPRVLQIGTASEDIERIPAPVETTPYKDDTLLAIQFECVDGWDDLQALYGLENTEDMPNQVLNAMRNLSWPCGDQPPAEQSDTVLSEMANDRTRPFLTMEQQDCASGRAKRFMYDYIEALSGSGHFYNSLRLERTVGHLTDTMIDEFQKFANCHDNQPACDLSKFKIMRLYYGHDVNELGFLNVLSNNTGAREFFENETPAFGSAVAVELWKREGSEAYVRVMVKNGVSADFKEFKYCDKQPEEYSRVGNFCTISSVRSAVDQFIGIVEPSCLLPTTTSAPTTTTTMTTTTTTPTTTTTTTTTSCGTWSTWSDWGPCIGLCNCGTKARRRNCTKGADGCDCVGDPVETGRCTTISPFPCPVPPYCCSSNMHCPRPGTIAGCKCENDFD